MSNTVKPHSFVPRHWRWRRCAICYWPPRAHPIRYAALMRQPEDRRRTDEFDAAGMEFDATQGDGEE